MMAGINDKIKKAGNVFDAGGNMRTFTHFGTVVKRYVNGNEKHLNICKQGIKKFAMLVSMVFDEVKIDYSEFSEEPGKLIIAPERIKPYASPEQVAAESSVPYSSMSLFLTIHDYQKSLDEKLKGMRDMLTPNGKIFVVDYNLSAWIHKTGNQKQVFKRWFNAGYEPAVLKSEPDCFKNHTWLSLDEMIKHAQTAGFETKHAEIHKLPYSKFFLYVGGK